MIPKIHVPKFEGIFSIVPRLFRSSRAYLERRLSRCPAVHSAPAYRVHCAGAPFAVAAFRDRESRCIVRRGAVPSGQPSALDCFACPRPRLAKALRPRLYGLRYRDLALLPQAVAPHPQVEDEEAAAVAGIGPRIGGSVIIANPFGLF